MVPLALKIAVALLLVLCLARAVLGDPPSRPHSRLALAVGAVGLAHAGLAATLGITEVAAVGTLWLCLAVWLARGRDDGFGEPGEDPPDPPVDWEAFDRERERWGSRTRV